MKETIRKCDWIYRMNCFKIDWIWHNDFFFFILFSNLMLQTNVMALHICTPSIMQNAQQNKRHAHGKDHTFSWWNLYKFEQNTFTKNGGVTETKRMNWTHTHTHTKKPLKWDDKTQTSSLPKQKKTVFLYSYFVKCWCIIVIAFENLND